METFKGLGHVGITVKDLDAAAAWYQEKLGFVVTKAFPTPDQPVELLEENGVRVMLLEMSGVIIELVEKAGSKEQATQWKDHVEVLGTRGINHLCFEVDDCDAAIRELASRGVELSLGPMTWPDLGFTNAHFFDPEGNDIEIMSFER